VCLVYCLSRLCYRYPNMFRSYKTLLLRQWTRYTFGWVWVWILCYDRRSVGQTVLEKTHPSGAYDQIFISVLTVANLLMWGALSDEKTGLAFTIAADPRQRSHSRVRVPWYSRPYSTVSDSRLPFSSPPTTRRATAEVFDPASTRDSHLDSNLRLILYR
jgi:hypothetical protein